MVKYLKYLGTNHLNGVYANSGLTENNFYTLKEISESKRFVKVKNDYNEKEWYCAELFEGGKELVEILEKLKALEGV